MTPCDPPCCASRRFAASLARHAHDPGPQHRPCPAREPGTHIKYQVVAMQRSTLKRRASVSSPEDKETRMLKALGTLEFLTANKIQHFKADVFRFHNLTDRQGREISRQLLHGDSDAAGDSDPEDASQPRETRGRKPKLGWPEIHAMDRIIEEYGETGRDLNWEILATEAGIEHISQRTVARAMGSWEWHMCIVCRIGYVKPAIAERRKLWAQVMLERFPIPEDWADVRISQELHFGYGQHQSVHLLRRPGMRYCQKCVQDFPPEENKATKREHAWGAVGFDFKSKVAIYTPKAMDGKIAMDEYVNQILEPVVKPWMARKEVFVLAEEPEWGHGGTRNTWDKQPVNKRPENHVQRWKREHELPSFFMCPGAPDFDVMENCWKAPDNARVRNIRKFDQETTRTLIREGWDAVDQEVINQRVLSMPQRLRACIELGGALTGY